MSWRVALSLQKLLEQINQQAPHRSTVSDGSIGDAAHAASVSDHNPDSAGVVHARDFTDDAIGGCDALILREQLRRSRDPRIKYVISEGQMFSSYPWDSYAPFTWRPYSGSNGHFHHVHVSVVSGSAADDQRAWAVNLNHQANSPIPTLPKGPGSKTRVKLLQGLLEVAADGKWGATTDEWAIRMRTAARSHVGYPKNDPRPFREDLVQKVIDTAPDNRWGPKSQAALKRWVEQFQVALGVKPDGAWGPATDRAFTTLRSKNLNRF